MNNSNADHNNVTTRTNYSEQTADHLIRTIISNSYNDDKNNKNIVNKIQVLLLVINKTMSAANSLLAVDTAKNIAGTFGKANNLSRK